MPDLFRGLAEGSESAALTRGLWVRRGIVTLLAVVALLALLGVAGQRGSTSKAANDTVTMKLGLPTALRGGLLWQAKLQIAAHRAVRHPRLVLAGGWTDGMQVNTIEPAAQGESSRDGRLVLSYDQLAPGDDMTVWFQFQVDPTQFGRHDVTLELDDAERPVARIARKLTVFP